MENSFDVVAIGDGPAGASTAVGPKMLGFRPPVTKARSRLEGLQSISPCTNARIATSAFATGDTVADAIHRSVVDEHVIATWVDARMASVTGSDGAFVTRLQSGSLDREAVSKKVVLASGVRASSGGLQASSADACTPAASPRWPTVWSSRRRSSSNLSRRS